MKEKKKESVTKFALAIRENAFEALLVLVFGVFNTAFGGDCISICRGVSTKLTNEQHGREWKRETGLKLSGF